MHVSLQDRQSDHVSIRCGGLTVRKWAPDRGGMTMLEVMVATAMFATVMTAVSVLLRGAHGAWSTHAADAEKIEAAHATVRHVVRKLRQATEVVSISAAADNSGQLVLSMSDASTAAWNHDGPTDQVAYGTQADLLADTMSLLSHNITGLNFVGYQADGVTTTENAEDIHAVQCEVEVELPSGARAVRCRGWLRSW